jgi:hypothetical protein
MIMKADKSSDSTEGYLFIRFSREELDIDKGTYMIASYERNESGYDVIIAINHDDSEDVRMIDRHLLLCQYPDFRIQLENYIRTNLALWSDTIRKIIEYITRPPLYVLEDTVKTYDIRFRNGMLFRALIREDGTTIQKENAYGMDIYQQLEGQYEIQTILDLIMEKEGIVDLKLDI